MNLPSTHSIQDELYLRSKGPSATQNYLFRRPELINVVPATDAIAFEKPVLIRTMPNWITS
jgi:hypothetical protein